MIAAGDDDRIVSGSDSRGFSGGSLVLAIGIVGAVLSPLLLGFEPVGRDPDLMYRPIKTVLAEALRGGTLPYWSDCFGVGVPIVAESHAAAFYPLNWLIYRLFGVSVAYRFLMWIHLVAAAAATHAYGRGLGLEKYGAALAAVAFTLGGFQAAHACHEPFYMLLPYLPLVLLLSERFLATGRVAWLAAMAVCWGTQLTLGHFQIQSWTGGLVLLTGLAWLARDRRCWRRVAALLGGLAWGLAVAAAQLFLTLELVRVSGFSRPEKFMTTFSFPPGRLAQWVLPFVYQSRNPSPLLEQEHPYWGRYASGPEEACAYIGTMALILACLGIASARRSRSESRSAEVLALSDPAARPTWWSPAMTMWLWVSFAGMVLATMPQWWPAGYRLVLGVPGFGLFRAPGRYMLPPTLGLALWAGRGLDRTIDPRRFRAGLLFAFGLLATALSLSISQTFDSGFRASIGVDSIPWRYAASLLGWVLAFGAILAWRRGRLGAWGPLGLVAIELAGLFYIGPTRWGWSVAVPGSSPMLERLKQEQGVALVAGRLGNLSVRAGQTTSYPIVGITAPPPNYLLESSTNTPPDALSPRDVRWHRRFGVSYGIWESQDRATGNEVLLEGEDPALTELLEVENVVKDRQRWKLIRHANPFPAAWVATRAIEVAGWERLFSALGEADHIDEAWFLPEDRPLEARPDPNRDPIMMKYGIGSRPVADIDLGPRATVARIVDWDGRSGTVEHDGSCVVILRRAFYPGWTARINDGPARPVVRVSNGLQGIVLTGKGPSQIRINYRPTHLGLGGTLSMMGILAAFGTFIGSAIVGRNRSERLPASVAR